jgi:DNA repair exonuclease SbcCD ATPase subunit
LGTQQRQ